MRSLALRDHERRAELPLQRELLAPARGTCGACPQQIEAFPKLCDRLDRRRTRERLLTGSKPMSDCLLGRPRPCPMMSQQSRLLLDDLREAVVENGRDTLVQLPPLIAEQSLVGDLLHEDVLERVDGVWRTSAAHDEPGGNELLERRVQSVFGERIRDGPKELVREFVTDHCRHLRDL